MIKKFIIFIILILLFIVGGVFLWWQGEKEISKEVEEKPSVTETTIVTGKVIPPSSIKPEFLTVVGLGETNVPDNQGNFSIKAYKDGVSIVSAIPERKEFGLMNIVITLNGNTITPLILDSKTTAKSMVFITPYFLTNDPQEAEKILRAMEDNFEINALAEVINQIFEQEDPLSDFELQESFKEAIESVANTLVLQSSTLLLNSKKNISSYKIFQLPKIDISKDHFLKLIFPSVLADNAAKEKKIVSADFMWMSLPEVNLKKDSNYSIKILNTNLEKGGINVDWNCYISDIGFDHFESLSDFEKKATSNRTIYSDEGDLLGITYIEGKSRFRYIDPSYGLEVVLDKIFGEGKLVYNINVPSDKDTIYLLRCFSGGMGKDVDASEKDFVKQELYRGEIRDSSAWCSNLVMGSLDGLSVMVDFSKGEELPKVVGAGIIEAQRSTLARHDNFKESSLQVATKVIKAMLEEIARNQAKEYSKTVAENSVFKIFARTFDIAVSKVGWMVKAPSATGKISDRIFQMDKAVTPLETSYIIVGDPFLGFEEGEKNKEESNASATEEKTEEEKEISKILTPTSTAPSIPLGKIAFVGKGAAPTICTANTDSTNVKELRAGLRPTWSPDGNRITFVNWANRNIGVMNEDGSNLQWLTDNDSYYSRVSWSPNGSKIAFTKTEGKVLEDVPIQLWIMDIDGGNKKKLPIDSGIYSFSWSPDGKKIAFSTSETATSRWIASGGRCESSSSIYLIDLDSYSQEKLVNGCSPVWSPNGKGIAFIKEERDKLYIMNPTSKETLLLKTFPFKVYDITWSPNGNWLALGVDYTGYSHRIYFLGPESQILRFQPSTSGIYHPTWSPR